MLPCFLTLMTTADMLYLRPHSSFLLWEVKCCKLPTCKQFFSSQKFSPRSQPRENRTKKQNLYLKKNPFASCYWFHLQHSLHPRDRYKINTWLNKCAVLKTDRNLRCKRFSLVMMQNAMPQAVAQALSSCHFLSEIEPEYVSIWQQSDKTDNDGRWCRAVGTASIANSTIKLGEQKIWQ